VGLVLSQGAFFDRLRMSGSEGLAVKMSKSAYDGLKTCP